MDKGYNCQVTTWHSQYKKHNTSCLNLSTQTKEKYRKWTRLQFSGMVHYVHIVLASIWHVLGSPWFCMSLAMSCSYCVPTLPVPPPAATVRWYSHESLNTHTHTYKSELTYRQSYDKCGKHVTLKIACACSQCYTNDSVFWLVQMTLGVMTQLNFPSFSGLNVISDSDKRVGNMSIQKGKTTPTRNTLQ